MGLRTLLQKLPRQYNLSPRASPWPTRMEQIPQPSPHQSRAIGREAADDAVPIARAIAVTSRAKAERSEATSIRRPARRKTMAAVSTPVTATVIRQRAAVIGAAVGARVATMAAALPAIIFGQRIKMTWKTLHWKLRLRNRPWKRLEMPKMPVTTRIKAVRAENRAGARAIRSAVNRDVAGASQFPLKKLPQSTNSATGNPMSPHPQSQAVPVR